MKMRTRFFTKVTEDKHIGHFLWLLRVFCLYVCHRVSFLFLWLLQEIVPQKILFLTTCAKPAEPTTLGTYPSVYLKCL